MSTDRLECLRCRGPMAAGFTLDHAQTGAVTSGSWVSGEPEKSVWTGLRLKGHEVLPITAHRCERCGLLELYANPAGPA